MVKLVRIRFGLQAGLGIGARHSSRVDTARVITWLRSIGEPRAYIFWKKFSFSPNVRVLFSSSGHRFAACTEEDQWGMDFMYWPEPHISEG